MGIITSLIIGGVVGWLASMIMGTKKSLFWYVVFGVLGGIIGSVLHFFIPIGGDGFLMDLVFGVIGTCLLIFGFRIYLGKQ
ncbi:MAG: hypothetical protein MJ131_06700 [Lachnospiraceae bacterium]|nr:hypothetical protein [Lachnospiraceae bacterium]